MPTMGTSRGCVLGKALKRYHFNCSGSAAQFVKTQVGNRKLSTFILVPELSIGLLCNYEIHFTLYLYSHIETKQLPLEVAKSEKRCMTYQPSC